VERKQRLTGRWKSRLPTNVIHTGETGILDMFAESHGRMIQNLMIQMQVTTVISKF
jgi:hypothetical protein